MLVLYVESGRVGEGEGLFVAAAVAFDHEGVGGAVGAEVGEDGVAFDAVPIVVGRVAHVGIEDNFDASVVAAGAGGVVDDDGVDEVDRDYAEGVGFVAALVGGDAEDVGAVFVDKGVGYAVVGDVALYPFVGASQHGLHADLHGSAVAGGGGGDEAAAILEHAYGVFDGVGRFAAVVDGGDEADGVYSVLVEGVLGFAFVGGGAVAEVPVE